MNVDAVAAARPEPPPGPGVVPPFVAPPTDGTRQRRWLAVGLAGGAALVLCVGGLFGLGGLVVFGSQMIAQRSQTAVTNYLNEIKARNYDAAYDQMCPDVRSQLTKYRFALEQAGQPEINSFTVGPPQVADNVVVPVQIVFGNNLAQNVKYQVKQDASTGDYEVCGEVD